MSSTQAMPAVATAAFQSSSILADTTSQWCMSQLQTCPKICYGSAPTNLCSTNDLSWTCLCSNGTVPDVTAFIDTLPFFICGETYSQCLAIDVNNIEGQQQCLNNEQCGTRNATAEYLAYQNVSAASSSVQTSSSTSSPKTSASTASSTSSSSEIATRSSPSTTAPSGTSSATTSIPSTRPPSGMATGTLVGIAVGSAVGGILLTAIAFLVYRRHKKRRRDEQNPETPTDPVDPHDAASVERPEFPGDGEKYGSRSKAGTVVRSEMVADGNRHELDNTEVSGTLSEPWSDPIGERHELGQRVS